MRRSPQLVVHEYDPLKRGVIIALLVVALSAGGWLLYEYGHSRADYDFISLQDERGLLVDQIENLTSDVAGLNDQLVASKRGNEIDKQAYAEVDFSLRAMQAEIFELKAEVAFYRSIVAPRESSRGLRIQRFQIVSSVETKNFSYKLVLTQVIKNNRITRGNIIIALEGVQDGKHRRLTLTEISAAKSNKLAFRFKYFQSFEGDIIIPPNFVPSRVHIKVVSNRVTLEKTFDWLAGKSTTSGSLKTDTL